MPTTTVHEGKARLEVPVPENVRAASDRGPGKIEGGLFFNPAMRFSRDLSVLFIEERAEAKTREEPFTVYDGLAATGARGIRLALECHPRGRRLQVHVNDRDPRAVELLKRNIAANGVTDEVDATCEDFVHALGTTRYDHVDVDPFGSPIPFLDAAIQHVRDHGSLAVTATDVTALCGVYPKVALRRYDAVPWHGPGMHEVALRILAGTAVRNAARHDLALRPVLSHATDHYIRVYLTARRGAGRADEALGHIGYALEAADGTRSLVPRDAPRPADAVRWAGPLWTGPLQDTELVQALDDRLDRHPRLECTLLRRFLARAAEEAAAPPLLYEIGEIGKRLKRSVPPMDALFAALIADGHRVARTHTSDTAFKTDATRAEIDAAFRTAAADAGPS